jgi:hypothetical protein
MTTTEERVSRLEGGFEHLATKADVANLKVWIMGLLLTVVVSVFLSAATLVIQLLS